MNPQSLAIVCERTYFQKPSIHKAVSSQTKSQAMIDMTRLTMARLKKIWTSVRYETISMRVWVFHRCHWKSTRSLILPQLTIDSLPVWIALMPMSCRAKQLVSIHSGQRLKFLEQPKGSPSFTLRSLKRLRKIKNSKVLINFRGWKLQFLVTSQTLCLLMNS